MKRLTKDYILKHIRETKYPLWSLYVIQNYRRVPIMHYNGDDFATEEKAEGKLEKSITRLQSILDDFPADAVLSIDLKKGTTANGSGILGPIEFVNKNKEDEDNTPQQNFSGLGMMPPAGFVSEATLNGKLEELRAENTKQINELIFKQREKDFNEKIARERAELDELKRELKDEQKKYESNTGAAAETLVFAVKKILKELFPNLQLTNQQPQLSGAEMQAAPEPPLTGKAKAVSDLADFLFDSNKFSEDDILKIKDQLSRAEAASNA